MKYIIFLADGMADYPSEALGGSTPLEKARVPLFDKLASEGRFGLVQTVPDGYSPGSDVANLSVMGYPPQEYYTGRSPLEAVSIGVEMKDDDAAFRANLVCLSGEGAYSEKTMADYSAGEITTAEAHELINFLKPHMDDDVYTLYGGISYRHLQIVNGMKGTCKLTPPHDISGKKVTDYLPDNAELLRRMELSHALLQDHPVNLDRVKRGLAPANSLWFWGQGSKPLLAPFREKYGLSGAVISAVDLIKGIGICAEMEVIPVEGATGTVETNFEGKAQAATEALKKYDFVYLHMEAPDECGHHFDAEGKILSLEKIHDLVLSPVWEYLKESGEDYRILLLPDHPTPLTIGTHVRDAVPFALYDSKAVLAENRPYTEEEAKKSGLLLESGEALMRIFVKEGSV